MTTALWMVHAREELDANVREFPGEKRNNARIIGYWKDAKLSGVTTDEVPWCAAFVGAMLRRAGLPSSGKANARSYETFGMRLQRPRPGCIVVLSRNGEPWMGHVGFYVGENDTRIQVLGGNQDDAVSLAWFDKSRVVCYRWPEDDRDDADVEQQLRESGSRTIGSADVVQDAIGKAVGSTIVIKGVDTAAQAVKPLTDATDVLSGVTSSVATLSSLLSSYWWVVVLFVAYVAWVELNKIKAARVDDAKSGVHSGRTGDADA